MAAISARMITLDTWRDIRRDIAFYDTGYAASAGGKQP